MKDSTPNFNELNSIYDNDSARRRLVYIPVEKLFPHPDNPRKDLGDLSELTDSIIANGVMQNLTVIRSINSTPEYDLMIDGKVKCSDAYRQHAINHAFTDDYTIIIGHRRHAAGVLAGVKELPCVITDMDYPTQIATMMTENLQRVDLTVYEQAQGFKQLSIDFGMSVDTIAEKTGFSASTVRRRLKMAELDQDTLKEVSVRQINLSDFERLDKIEDEKLRNEALKDIGTANFSNRCAYAEQEINKRKRREELRQLFLGAGLTEISESTGNKRDKYRQVNAFYGTPPQTEIEELAAKENNIRFYVDRWNYVYVVTPIKEKEKTEQSAKENALRQKAQERLDACAALKEAFERAFKLRFDFIKNYSESEAKKHLPEILQLMHECAYDYIPALFYKLIGFTDEELDKFEDVPTWGDCLAKGITTYRTLLYHAYALTDDNKDNKCYVAYTYSAICGRYSKSEILDDLYTALGRLGYEMSDEEKALMDGTSELYVKEDN